MEFSEYLQLDRMAHWPRFLRHPVYLMGLFVRLHSTAIDSDVAAWCFVRLVDIGSIRLLLSPSLAVINIRRTHEGKESDSSFNIKTL